MEILLVLMIALSLSMDAFSLSLAYGTISLERKEEWRLSCIVGIYHFFMPLFGMTLGNLILKILPIPMDVIVFVLLVFIGIQMLVESRKEEIIDNRMNILEAFLFGFAVSIDSFSIGIGLTAFTSHVVIASILFAFSSFLFTKLGLILGKSCRQTIGSRATKCGGIILIVIGIISLL